MRKQVREAVVKTLTEYNIGTVQDTPFIPKIPEDEGHVWAIYTRSEAPSNLYQPTLTTEFREITLDVACWVVGSEGYANKIDTYDARIHQVFHRNQDFGLNDITSVYFQQFTAETPEQVGQKTLCLGRWSFGVVYPYNLNTRAEGL